MMGSIFEYAGTIDPGITLVWEVGGNGWFQHDDKPLMDAHPILYAIGGVLPLRVPLVYFDPACQLEEDNTLSYYISIRNDGYAAIWFHFRVWVP